MSSTEADATRFTEQAENQRLSMFESKETLRPLRSGPTQNHRPDGDSHKLSSAPMVYSTPNDSATSARRERDRLVAEGANPDSVILMSDLFRRFPRQEGESSTDYAQRSAETMRTMIASGVSILNDQIKTNREPSSFVTADGRSFDLGPKSGVTRAQYHQFREWFDQTSNTPGAPLEVPEKWRTFEKKTENTSD